MSGDPGVLVLAATPIGDPRDAAPRLAAELSTAEVVAAEDTRRLRTLAAALGVTVTGRVISLFDANEAARVELAKLVVSAAAELSKRLGARA